MVNGRIAASAPWWQDVVRFWVPMLGIGGAVLLQMISGQRAVGELRTDMAVQSGALREEIGTLRSELEGEIATLRNDLGERIARLEALMEILLEGRAQDSAPEPGTRPAALSARP